MRINIKNPIDCCGCTACESICPHNAIQMDADGLGFLYPKINNDLCVDCGLCYKVCKFKEEYIPIASFGQPEVYGVRHTEEKELIKSQSGAAFWAFAEHLLKEGYVIFGVGYGKDFHVMHKRVETIEKCQELRGSKYAQSDLRGIYKEIKLNLSNGEKILFTGTPCQVAGLKSYLPQRLQTNLLTIDLVCHAVPSPKIWEEYVKWIEKKYKNKVLATDFRNKRFGWHSHFETFQLEGSANEIVRSTYRSFFYEHLSVRESCANCKFTNLRRPGDLTIGDYWGWEKHFSDWNDNKGVSLLLVNTEKGKLHFDKVNSTLLCSIKSNTYDCLQPQLTSPIKLNPKYGDFINDFSKKGFKFVGKKYGDLGMTYRMKSSFQLVRRIIRRILTIFTK